MCYTANHERDAVVTDVAPPSPTRPVLRWHGGKWRIAPWIIGHFPKHRVYTEVFGGAASVLMRKSRSYAEIYNDLDGEIVNLFRVLQDPRTAGALRDLLRLTPFAREEFNLAYIPSAEPVERARRLVIVGFMGFGSNGHNTTVRTGFRAKSNRSGTTPAHDWAHWPEKMGALVERLQGVVIEQKDAFEVLEQHDSPETLHYVDPPYVHSTRDLGGERGSHQRDYRHELDDVGHRRLAALLHRLTGMVVLSGYPAPLYDVELYADWHRVEKESLADGARKRVEVLWMNRAAHLKLVLGDLA